MRQMTLTLFDFTDPEQLPEPLSVQWQYDHAASEDGLAGGPLKVCLGMGDYLCHAQLTFPLDPFTQLMKQLMSLHAERASSALVGFDKPSIIKPH